MSLVIAELALSQSFSVVSHNSSSITGPESISIVCHFQTKNDENLKTAMKLNETAKQKMKKQHLHWKLFHVVFLH